MSYQVPIAYSAPEATAIPSVLVGDELKQFAGMRTLTKFVPSSSGATVQPNSSCLFNIPAEAYGYIKPNSMYLKGYVTVTYDATKTAPFVSANEHCFAFAGNTNVSADDDYGLLYNLQNHGTGGASSMFSRVTVTLPGGASMSYAQHHHWRNAVMTHALSAEYVQFDLREMEYAGETRSMKGSLDQRNNAQAQIYFSIPMDIPLFNGSTAFPLLLCSGGISLEITTAAVGEAFTCGAKTGGVGTAIIDTYQLSNLGLVYEVMSVSSEFKSALVSSRADRGYMIHVADRTVVGPVQISGSTRYNFGVGLASCKGVLFTEILTSVNNQIGSAKGYSHNAMDYYNVYRDGQQMSIPNITSSDVAFIEMNRALGRINDSNVTSRIVTVANSVDTNARTSYTASPAGAFLAGCSFQNISDWSFAAQGTPCDQIAIDIYKVATSSTRASQTTAFTTTEQVRYAERWGKGIVGSASLLYIWVLYDTVVVVMPDGTCQIRK